MAKRWDTVLFRFSYYDEDIAHKICSDVQNRVGTLQLIMCSNVQNRMGTPQIKMCSDVPTRVGTPHKNYVQMFKIGWGHRT